jgi:hypothetical protein
MTPFIPDCPQMYEQLGFKSKDLDFMQGIQVLDSGYCYNDISKLKSDAEIHKRLLKSFLHSAQAAICHCVHSHDGHENPGSQRL